MLYTGAHRDHTQSVSAGMRCLDEHETETLNKLTVNPVIRDLSVGEGPPDLPAPLEEIAAVSNAVGVWIYSPEGVFVQSTGEVADALPARGLTPSEVTSRGSGATRSHFYVHHRRGLVSIRFGRIFSPDGNAGYVASARYLDQQAIQTLVDHTDCLVELGSRRTKTGHADDSAGSITDTVPLPGRQGETIDTLSFRHSSSYISKIILQSQQTMLMAVALVAVLTSLFFIALHFWVSRPISILTSFMQGEEPAVLGGLLHSDNEFGKLALLAKEHRSQRLELERNFQRLNQAEQRMRFHFEQTSLAVIEWDCDMRIVEWNRAAERMFGYTREEAIGRSGFDLIIMEKLQDHASQLWPELLAASGPVSIETLNRRKQGEAIFCEWYNTPLLANGEVVGVASLAMDVTAKVTALEEAKRAREDAVEASRMKSEFLANMSHEIRTPMNGVVGMAGLLLDTPLNKEQRAMAETIAVSADGLLCVINDILDLSKIEAGKMDCSPAPFDMQGLIDQIVRMFGPQAEQAGLTLLVNIDEEVPRFLLGDGARVRQIITNLLSNSLKFTHQGSITLSVASSGKDRIRISVRDTGIGIPLDRQEAIFEAFTQADGSTTRKYGGTGLGLTICRHLARIMGGALGLSSRIGEGAEFWVDLPMAEARMRAEEPATDSSQDQFGLTVLLAEDNPVNERVAQRMLTTLGCTVVVARNGAEAVRIASVREFDVILMDVHMPVMDGIDATQNIRSRGIGTPIIALTASVMKTDIERCQEAGMNSFLPKPVRREELTQALMQIASLSQAA